jgi:hypothetical protein
MHYRIQTHSRQRRCSLIVRALVSFCALMLCACMADDSVGTPTPAPTSAATPDIPNWGSTPTMRDSFLPLVLDCSRVPYVTPGPSWRGLTIGVSTFDDVRRELAPAEPWWDTQVGNLQFWNPTPSADEWSVIQTCFVGNVLSVLKISNSPEFSGRPLDEWVAEYGRPDRVTWSSYFSRSVIWAEAGILATIDVEFGTTSIVIFLPHTQRSTRGELAAQLAAVQRGALRRGRSPLAS